MEHLSLYDQALMEERRGKFTVAYELFQSCLSSDELDRGDISFHLGWCLEQSSPEDQRRVMELYNIAANTAAAADCRVNSWFRLGWLQMHQKDFVDAAISFREAIEAGEQSGVRNDPYQQAAYWYAVCGETLGRYLEAAEWYRFVQRLSPALDPEARLREIHCLNAVGRYEDAFNVCDSFDNHPPEGFSSSRYQELFTAVKREQEILRSCLSTDQQKAPANI